MGIEQKEFEIMGHVKVLVLDDEPSIRESLSEYLRDFGYQVQSAESAEEAIKLMELEQPDVAIVDIRLPGMDGDKMIQLCSRAMPKLQYVVHTGSVAFSVHEELEALGITDQSILRKPVLNMLAFVDSIDSLVGHA